MAASSTVSLLLADGTAPAPAPAANPATTSAQAQPQPMAGCGGGSQGLAGMLPFVLIFVIFYFMLIRPQQKKAKEQQSWLASLKKDDEVVTNGGLIGKITGLTDQIVTIELQEKVRVRVLRSHIAGMAPGAKSSAPAANSK